MSERETKAATMDPIADHQELEIEELPPFQLALLQGCGDAEGPGW